MRAPSPTVSPLDIVVKMRKTRTEEDVNVAVKVVAGGPMKGIAHFGESTLVSSDFKHIGC